MGTITGLPSLDEGGHIIILQDCNRSGDRVPILGRARELFRSQAGWDIDFVDVDSGAKGDVAWTLLREMTLNGDHPRARPIVFLANTAPRSGGRKDTDGCPFGIVALGPNRFYFGTLYAELSYVKGGLSTSALCHQVPMSRTTQFRSLSQAEVFHDLLTGELEIRERLDLENIPAVHPQQVASRESNGNIHTTLTADALAGHIGKREHVSIRINGRTAKARIGSSIQDGQSGELILHPGSTQVAGQTLYDLSRLNGRAEWCFTRLDEETKEPLFPRSGDLIEFPKFQPGDNW